MGTIRKIGNDYYVEFFARGLRYQRNGGKDKAAAQALLNDIEDQIAKGEMKVVVHDVEAGAFFKDVLALLRHEHTSRTFSHYQSVIEGFQEFLSQTFSDGFKLSKVTPSVIEDYRAYLIKKATKPINFTLILLSDIMDYAISLGHLNDNPTLHTQFADDDSQEPPRTLDRETIGQLLEGTSGSAKDALVFLLNTGVRFEEMVSLQWSNIDFKENILTVNKRAIPMNSEVLSVLKPMDQSGGSIFVDVSKKSYTPLAQNNGMEESAFFDTIRHTFARNVLEKGVPLVGLSKLLGLEDIEDVMPYLGFVNKKRL